VPVSQLYFKKTGTVRRSLLDGKKLDFKSERAGGISDVHVMDADGSNKKQLDDHDNKV
jgi:Tol biopolymer transport system component